MAKKHTPLVLQAVGGTATMKRGQVEIQKGFRCPGIYLYASVQVANTTGGPVAGLTEARKLALLAAFQLTYVKYGHNLKQNPFNVIDFKRLRYEARRAYQSEIEGWSDSSTGMGQTINNGATGTIKFRIPIPTGKCAALERATGLKDAFGIGRSQLLTHELQIKWLSTAVDTGLAITGTPTFEVVPHTVPGKGDPWLYYPEYREQDETDKRALLPDGLPLAVSVRNEVLASSTLTNFSLLVDGALVHDQVTPEEAIVPVNDDPEFPSAGLLSDAETPLYVVASQRLREALTGRVQFIQNVKNLSTANMSWLGFPTVSSERVKEDLEDVATNIRRKTLRAVSLPDAEGWTELPENVKAFMPSLLVDNDDSEMERLGGPTAAPGRPAEILFPEGYVARVKAIRADHIAAGELKAANKVERVAAAVPGAIDNGRGFSRPSTWFDSIRRLFA